METLNKAHDFSEPLTAPVRLDLSITEQCNTCCPYCWQLEHTKVGNLTFEVLAPAIKDLCSWRPLYSINITGGEPTIWKGFEEFVFLCKNEGVKNIWINTNAIRLANMSFLKKILKAGVTAIGVSIDTLNPEKHLELRRFPFSKMQKALDNLYEIQNTEGFNIYISFNAVLNKLVTPEEVAELKDYANSRKWGFFCQAVFKGPALDKYGITKEERDARDKAIFAKDDCPDPSQGLLEVVQNTDKFSRDTHPLQKPGARCLKGQTTLKITSNGSVRFCWNGPNHIGNILNTPILEIWKGAEAKKAREYIREKECRCLFDCDIYESLGLEWIYLNG